TPRSPPARAGARHREPAHRGARPARPRISAREPLRRWHRRRRARRPSSACLYDDTVISLLLDPSTRIERVLWREKRWKGAAISGESVRRPNEDTNLRGGDRVQATRTVL